MSKKFFALTMLLIAGTVSCKSAPHLSPKYKPIDEVVKLYNDSLRWKDFDTAGLFILPEDQKEFEAFTKLVQKDLNIEDWKIKKITMSEQMDKAEVLIERSYVQLPSIALKQQEVLQHWVWLKNNWYIEGPPF